VINLLKHGFVALWLVARVERNPFWIASKEVTGMEGLSNVWGA
jgi:hypothetical protein